MKNKLIISIVTAVTLACSIIWYQINWNREVDGKSLRQWHQSRVEGFTSIRKELRPLSEMAKGDAPFDVQKVAMQSQQVFAIAETLNKRFSANAPSGDAKAEIWYEGSDFNQRLLSFIEKTQRLAGAPPDNFESLRSSMDELQKHCSECHKRYRD